MAGRISIDLARLQGAHLDCVEYFANVDSGIPGHMPLHLRRYWTFGPGGARKIRWGTDGSMKRCIRLFRKYFPRNPGGTCAILHKQATGQWPTEGGIAGIPS